MADCINVIANEIHTNNIFKVCIELFKMYFKYHLKNFCASHFVASLSTTIHFTFACSGVFTFYLEFHKLSCTLFKVLKKYETLFPQFAYY